MHANINMDFGERAVIDTNKLAWVDSPLAGVHRRMLEREGAETGRATSIVRYAPKSYFSSHEHSGGEEFLVLDGVFSDEFGDFGPGSYVRNPVGSKHRPHSDDGCTIFVKLSQMARDDQLYVRRDTRGLAWGPTSAQGVSVLPLHQYGGEEIALYRWQPDIAGLEIKAPRGFELFVLNGEIDVDGERYEKGTWLRVSAVEQFHLASQVGATAYIKTGHLSAG